MDRAKFFWVIGRYKTVDNPISLAKVDQVIDALHLTPEGQVLDIASGKAEMLCRIATKYGVRCTGVERSKYFCEEAIEKIGEYGLTDLVAIHHMDGQDFKAPDASYDVSMCIGAEWVFGGLKGTLTNLARWTKSGGTVAVGTPFWSSKPAEEYLQAQGFSQESFSSHEGNVGIGWSLGLNLIYTVVSNHDEWDNYVGLSWLAAYDFIREQPGDPDALEIAELTARDKASYLKYQRECLNWGIYLFRKP